MRKYRGSEEPAVGDIVAFSKPGEHAFDSCIIQSIKEDGTVFLERPHMRTSDPFQSSYVGIERFETTLDRLTRDFSVYTTGPSERIDNRAY